MYCGAMQIALALTCPGGSLVWVVFQSHVNAYFTTWTCSRTAAEDTNGHRYKEDPTKGATFLESLAMKGVPIHQPLGSDGQKGC